MGIALAVGFVVTTMSEREPTQIEFKDLGELSFGQFVDNEVYISMGIDKNLGKSDGDLRLRRRMG